MNESPNGMCNFPHDCDRIIIVGAGGFGREVLQLTRQAWPEHVSKIAGFLSADPGKLDGHAPALPILGSPVAFEPQPSDGFLLAIGVPGVRRQVAEGLESKKSRFLTLVHPTAVVASSAQIGPGSILCPFSVVSDEVTIGRCVILNYHASVGHDCRVGDFAVLSPYATIGGEARVSDDAFLGLHASVGPNIVVGPRAKISSNSCVLASTPADSLVFGVPGRIVRHVAVE